MSREETKGIRRRHFLASGVAVAASLSGCASVLGRESSERITERLTGRDRTVIPSSCGSESCSEWSGNDDGASPGVDHSPETGVLRIDVDGSGDGAFPSARESITRVAPVAVSWRGIELEQGTPENNFAVGFTRRTTPRLFTQEEAAAVYFQTSSDHGERRGADGPTSRLKVRYGRGETLVVSSIGPVDWSRPRDVTITYDGLTAAVSLDGHQGPVASLSAVLPLDGWRAGVTLEDDPDRTSPGSVLVRGIETVQ